jgi:hypothetical protein
MMFVRNQQTTSKVDSILTDVAEVTASLLDPLCESLLSLTNPDTGVVELESSMNNDLREDSLATDLLVGLVRTLGVANLSDQVIFFLENEVLGDNGQSISPFSMTFRQSYPDTSKVSKLSV